MAGCWLFGQIASSTVSLYKEDNLDGEDGFVGVQELYESYVGGQGHILFKKEMKRTCN